MEKEYKIFPPIMEGLLDMQDVLLSLDYGSVSAPNGTIDFFETYGYFVVDNLFQFDGSNHGDGLTSIKKILRDKVKLNINNEVIEDYLFTNKNNSIPKIKKDLVAIYQSHTNLNEIPLYIKTKNNERHCVSMKRGRIICVSRNIKMSYSKSLVGKVFNKFLNENDYYFYQIFYGFDLND